MKRGTLRPYLAVSSIAALVAIVSGCGDGAAPPEEAHGDGPLARATSALLTGNTCVYGQPCQSAEVTVTIQRGGGVGNVFDTGIDNNGVSSNGGSGISGTIPIGDSGVPATARQELMSFDLSPITNVAGAGYTVVGAQVSLSFCTTAAGQTIDVHQATQPWGATAAQRATYETTVSWPTFDESFVATPIASFSAGAANGFPGCIGSGHTPSNARFDLTSLVSGWVNGTVPQDGILMEQPPVPGVSTIVLTSEFPPALSGYHPTLFVTFDVACANGTADCNDDGLDGCETDLTTTASCGACGNACAAGATCQNGACVTAASCPCSFTGSWPVDDCVEVYGAAGAALQLLASDYSAYFFVDPEAGSCEAYSAAGTVDHGALSAAEVAACTADLLAYDTAGYCAECTSLCPTPSNHGCSFNPPDDDDGNRCF